jgi:hypothetical protein
MVMLKFILMAIIITTFISCDAEPSADWNLQWLLKSTIKYDYEKMSHIFKINIDKRTQFFKSGIDSNGKLIDNFIVYGLAFYEVEEIKPSVEFKLFIDTTVLIDTVFTWDEMEFDGSLSRKVITLDTPNLGRI